MTKREEILQYIFDLLKSEMNLVSSDKITRSKVILTDEKLLPCIDISWAAEEIEEVATGKFNRTLPVVFKIEQKGETPDSKIDPIINKLEEIILKDRTLGGLVMDVTPETIDPRFDIGNKPIIEIEYIFKIKYRT